MGYKKLFFFGFAFFLVYSGLSLAAPNVILNYPSSGNNSIDFGNVTFNCSAWDGTNSLTNISLYSDYNGSWLLMGFSNASGLNYSASFSNDIYFQRGIFIDSAFKWNCLAENNISGSAFASSNFTFSSWDRGTHNKTMTDNRNLTLYKAAEWNKSYSNSSLDSASSVATDSNNNIIASGVTYLPQNDFLIIKYDENGSLLWVKIEGYAGKDVGGSGSVDVDLKDNVIVSDATDFTDAVAIKYNASGNQVWNKSYSGSAVLIFSGAVDKKNNYLTAGVNDSDFFTLKYDENGTLLWLKTFDTGSHDECWFGVAVDSKNNILQGGDNSGFGIYVLKSDENGTPLWNRTYSGGYNDGARGIAVDSNDNAVVIGYSDNVSDRNFVILKYDENGTMLWNKTYDGGRNETGFGIAVTSKDNIVVTGRTAIGLNDSDILTIIYDQNGTPIWIKSFDNGKEDATEVAVDKNDDIIVQGINTTTPSTDYLTIKYTFYSPKATYTSQIFNTSSYAPYGYVSFDNITWKNYTPANTSIQIRTRVSEDNVSWTNWSADHQNPSGFIGVPYKYIQYQAVFETNDTTITPAIEWIMINYTPITPPDISTLPNLSVYARNATLVGNITSTGGNNASIRGFKYGLTPADIWDKNETGNFSIGAYSLQVTGLTPATTYYYRAYASNLVGSGYGGYLNFTTSDAEPDVSTKYPKPILLETVYAKGEIQAINGKNVTVRGFKYGLNESDTWDINETGNFLPQNYSLQITGLEKNTAYHIRAYATNQVGTSYGPWIEFKTGADAAVIINRNTIFNKYIIFK